MKVRKVRRGISPANMSGRVNMGHTSEPASLWIPWTSRAETWERKKSGFALFSKRVASKMKSGR